MPADPTVGDAYRQEYQPGEAEDLGEIIAVVSTSTCRSPPTTTWSSPATGARWNPTSWNRSTTRPASASCARTRRRRGGDLRPGRLHDRRVTAPPQLVAVRHWCDPRTGCGEGWLMKLLVIEDDVKIATAVRRGLEAEGYAVDVAVDGTTGCGGRPRRLRPDRARPHAAAAGTASRSVPELRAAGGGRRSSCSPRRTASSTRPRRSTPAPTTTYQAVLLPGAGRPPARAAAARAGRAGAGRRRRSAHRSRRRRAWRAGARSRSPPASSTCSSSSCGGPDRW